MQINTMDALKVINRLNGVWLLNSKLGVNISRFKGRTSYSRKVSKSSTIVPNSKREVADVSPGTDARLANGNMVVSQKKSYLQVFWKIHFNC
ncbi:hypothetical protein REPUB_Repub19eG0136700 [Reevesia pubescens]